jgi:dTDP-4-amino-4,6-dideoxygalactose transaminase
VQLPHVPEYATNNAHMYYLVTAGLEERTRLIEALKADGYHAVFHYLSLHRSPFYRDRHDGRSLPQADRYTECLLRLPLYYELDPAEADRIAQTIRKFYGV